MDNMDSMVLIKEDGNVARIIVNRPSKLNALNIEVIKELKMALAKIEKREDIRVVIITGAGDRAFIAGADINEFLSCSSMKYHSFGELYFSFVNSIMKSSKPVIAVVNGYAFGGGCIIALACDFILASEKSKFGQQEINLGFMGGASYLPKLVGKHKAMEIVLLGDVFDVQDAYEMGLIYKIVPEDDLINAAQTLASKLLSKSPFALKMAKKTVNMSLEVGYSAANDYEIETSSLCFSSPEIEYALKAFLENK